MNYSTALHPIKNFAKTLPELINEEAAAGMEISSSNPILADLSDKPWFQEKIADQLNISVGVNTSRS